MQKYGKFFSEISTVQEIKDKYSINCIHKLREADQVLCQKQTLMMRVVHKPSTRLGQLHQHVMQRGRIT